MVLLNDLAKQKSLPRSAAEKFVLMLSVFSPHIGEELWEKLGHDNTCAYEEWPVWDEAVLKVDEVEVLVQVLGKPKARIMMPAGCPADVAEKLALENEDVKKAIEGKNVVKVICVPGRLVNIVVK